jgi:hypothetical protein
MIVKGGLLGGDKGSERVEGRQRIRKRKLQHMNVQNIMMNLLTLLYLIYTKKKN